MILDKNVLTIAGSDSSGGAGIQADLKTFSANGVYGMSVLTSVTAQNSLGVNEIENLSGAIVKSQMDSLFSDIRIDSVKIGMIPNEEVASQVAESLTKKKETINNKKDNKENANTSANINNIDAKQKLYDFNIVLDPVMISTSGKKLMSDEAMKVVVEQIFPICDLITPNIPEAESLTGIIIDSEDSLKRAAKILFDLGPKHVLIKGGHMNEKQNNEESNDILFDGTEFIEYKGERIEGVSPHGTGCTLSSAIATNLAKGMSMTESVKIAKQYITTCIKNSIKIGQGDYFLNHFASL